MSIRQILGRNATGIAAIAVACPVIAAGIVILLSYANTPGRAGASHARWPSNSAVQRTPHRPTLVVFAHPDCPCTNATIAELARIMASHPKEIDAVVFFVLDQDAPHASANSGLWKNAAAIPGVRTLADPDGVEARRFGAFTSGQTLLYDARGRLAFSGGITASRGHEGDSDGQDAILAALAGRGNARAFTSVFGCFLIGHE